MLRSVEKHGALRIGVRWAWIVDRKRAGRGQILEIALPREFRLLKLIHEATRGNRMRNISGQNRIRTIRVYFKGNAVPRIVIVDAESVAAQHGYVIGFAWMDLAIETGSEPVSFRKAVQLRRIRTADDLIETLILRNDYKDMLVTRHLARGGVESQARRQNG